MTKLENWVRKNLLAILVVLLAAGYLLIMAELVLYNHWQGLQLIAPVTTLVGLAALVVGYFLKGTARVVVALLLVVLSISGIVGTFEHRENERGERRPPVAFDQAGTIAVADRSTATVNQTPAQGQPTAPGRGNRGEGGEGGEGGEARPRFPTGGFRLPPPAPLSLTGLAMLSALVVFAKPDRKPEPADAPVQPS